MKKIGIAISVYNKVNELATNINVIRKHWPDKDVFVSVCCNDTNSIDLIKTLDIDHLSIGIDYKKNDAPGEKGWKRMRQYDTIKKAILGCVGNAEYIAQWHADAYALDQEVLFNMINCMKTNHFKVAFRGKWKIDPPHPKMPTGHIDDHFVMFNSLHVSESSMFSENIEQISRILSISDQWNSEGILSYIIQNVTSIQNLWHYNNMNENIIDQLVHPGEDPYYDDGIKHSAIPPLNFDPKRKFLHSDSIEYTKKYFRECGVPNSLIVENLI